MELSIYLRTVADGYNRHAGLRTPTQRLLRSADAELRQLVPAGLKIMGSGGKGTATLTPWVGVFDPDETSTPEEGLYVVYLWASDLGSVTLMLLQGITRLDRAFGHAEARRLLAAEATAIRGGLRSESIAGLETSANLGASGFRQLGYTAACVIARRYEFVALPSETELRLELEHFLQIYQDALEVKRRLALKATPTTTADAAAQLAAAGEDLLAHFRPKDDSEYISHIEGRDLLKSRRHERLVAEYGEWAAGRGFAASTQEHPRDLVLRRDGEEWLVEAKILYRGNATAAVRAALGQLFTYRYFLWRSQAPPPHLLALFSEPVGNAYVDFLEQLGVGAVWKESGEWHGSTPVRSAGLCA